MKKLYTLGFGLVFVSVAFFVSSDIALAEVKLPSWSGSGNLDKELDNKGKAIAKVASTVVAALAIIGMLVGAAFFAVNKGEEGKKWIFGGGIGLIVAGSVAAIATLFLTK